jgi:transcriptional regulator GlxA family with amidase domain
MDRRIKAAIQIMLDSKKPRVQIRELAQSVNLSPRHFAKLFKEETCLTPKQCARYWRLQQAKNLLDHTFLRVNKVASAVGFRHLSSFTREFTKLYGCPPSVFTRRSQFRGHCASQGEKRQIGTGKLNKPQMD